MSCQAENVHCLLAATEDEVISTANIKQPGQDVEYGQVSQQQVNTTQKASGAAPWHAAVLCGIINGIITIPVMTSFAAIIFQVLLDWTIYYLSFSTLSRTIIKAIVVCLVQCASSLLQINHAFLGAYATYFLFCELTERCCCRIISFSQF